MNTTNLNTEEGNRLIAEFMGLQLGRIDPSKTADDVRRYDWWYRIVDGTKEWVCEDIYLKYHSSWDWLMPVWFKIQNWYTQEFGVMTSTFEISNIGIMIKATHSSAFRYANPILMREVEVKDLWQAVTQFIQWYQSSLNK